ncbi:MAG: bifunctional nuclease domain-containing protein, partial [Marinirhabdus sp.]
AIALEKEIKPPRPLTHDLFKNFAHRYGIVIKQVIIHKLVDGVFYSSIICEREASEELIDARTSDAIALALRFDAPIFTYKDILDKAGIYLKSSPPRERGKAPKPEETVLRELVAGEDKQLAKPHHEYTKATLKQLNKMLAEAVANEDYEKAAGIRDEISSRT